MQSDYIFHNPAGAHGVAEHWIEIHEIRSDGSRCSAMSNLSDVRGDDTVIVQYYDSDHNGGMIKSTQLLMPAKH